jgi:hypothetical protein
MRDLRRLVAALVIGSFSIAALFGIIALIGGGELGETEGRVLLTTVIVGVESIAMLCYLSVASRRTALVGLLGGLTSLLPFGLALWFTWAESDSTVLWQTFGVGVTIAATLAQACLLLALHQGGRTLLLVATLAAMAVVAAMISNAIVNGENLGDLYWRLFGVVAILDVLGTVVFAALGLFSRRAKGDDGEADLITPALEARVAEAARSRGVSASQLISDALDSYLS